MSKKHLYLFIFFLAASTLSLDLAFSVGGFTQMMIINNQTNFNLFLHCKNENHNYREAQITIPPQRANYFLNAYSEDFSNLLGGTYACEISVGKIENRHFGVTLPNSQENLVWTFTGDFEISGEIKCDHEPLLNFNRSSEIVDIINNKIQYNGTRCDSVDTSKI